MLNTPLRVNVKKEMWCWEGNNKQDMVPDNALEATNMEQNSDNSMLYNPSIFINYYRID